MVEKECQFCSMSFLIYPSKDKLGRGIYCSEVCSDKARNVNVSCLFCGINFTVHLSSFKNGGGVYCSRDCFHKDHQLLRVCAFCSKEFVDNPSRVKIGRGIFCSKICFNNSRSQVTQRCQSCGKDFSVDPCQIAMGKGIYCSMACYGDAQRGDQSRFWKGGASKWRSSYRGPGWKSLSKTIRERDKYICQHCGASDSGRAFPVHHVVPWWNFSNWKAANRKSNLITLCHKCHFKAESDVPVTQLVFLSQLFTFNEELPFLES